MPRDGIVPDLRGFNPDKVAKRDLEIPRMPSPFSKYLNREEEGVQVVEADIPSVSGEQRRMLLQAMIPKVMDHIGLRVVVLAPLRYVTIPETRETMSRVAFTLGVFSPKPQIKEFRFNVPPHGNWHREVMTVILEFLWVWGHKIKAS